MRFTVWGMNVNIAYHVFSFILTNSVVRKFSISCAIAIHLFKNAETTPSALQ